MFRKDKKTKKGSNSLPDDDDMLQKDFDPRHHLQRELTNERVSLLFFGLRKAAPDACVHTSVCLESDVDMLANVMEAAIEFMSSQDRTNKPDEETGPVFLESMQLNTAQIWWKNALEANSHDEWATQRCGYIGNLYF